MYRYILGTLLILLIASACAPAGTPQPPAGYKFSHVYVSQGVAQQITLADEDISITLVHEGGLDTSGVVVTVLDLGMSYMVETADPMARFLPALQFAPRLDVPLQEIVIAQIPVEQEPFIQVLGGPIPDGTKGEFLGTTRLSDLRSFLSRWILGNSVNILFDVPPHTLETGEFEVYRTPGTLSFFLDIPDSVLSSRDPDPYTQSTQERNTVVIRLLSHTFETIESTTLVYRAGFLLDEFLITQAGGEPGIPVTGPEDEAPTECGQDGELVTFEVDGQTFTECRPTVEIIPPSATPEIDTDTFPAVNPQILGDCPESVHNRYAVEGPDGHTYRTWHPIIVGINPSGGGSQLCSFAHEHGDPPHPDAPLPYFGYPAYHAGEFDVIRQHEGYKVFTHIQGQRTGWNTRELSSVNPDIDMQFWAHQGSWRASRLTDQYHDVGFWSQDGLGHLTEVYYLADTGDLFKNCPGEVIGAKNRTIASSCDYSMEVWDFGGEVGNAWRSLVQVVVTNPMNFMLGDLKDLPSVQLISTSEEICAESTTPCDFVLPFGHMDSIWLGNQRILKDANWQWSNEGGSDFFCTYPNGNLAEDMHCSEGEYGYLRQRVPTIKFFGGISGVWDRTVNAIGDYLHLPFGAPGGN